MFKHLLSAVVALLGATMAAAGRDIFGAYTEYYTYPTEYKFTKVCSDSMGYYYYYPKSCRAKEGWYYRPYSYIEKDPSEQIVEILVVQPYKHKPHHKKCWHYCTKAHGCGWYTVPKPTYYYGFYKQYAPAVAPSPSPSPSPVNPSITVTVDTSVTIYSYYNPPATCVQAPQAVYSEVDITVTIEIMQYFTSYCFFAYQPETHYYYIAPPPTPAPSPSPVPPPTTDITYVDYICWGDCCFYQLPSSPSPAVTAAPASPSPCPVDPSPSPVYYPSPSPSVTVTTAAPSPSPSPVYYPSPSPSVTVTTTAPSPSPSPCPSPSPEYHPSPSPSVTVTTADPSPSPVASPDPSPCPSPSYPW